MAPVVSVARLQPEEVVFIRSRGSDLFGVLTRPAVEPEETAVLLLSGAAEAASFGRNQVRARLARRLAELGFPAMRVDYPGTGESTGSAPEARLDEGSILPLVEDAAAIAGWLRERGSRHLVVAGSCLGSRVALTCPGRVPDVGGLVLITPPVHDYDHRRMPESGGPEGRFVELLRDAIDAGLPALLVYGRPDRFATDFELARRGKLGDLLRTAGDLVTVSMLDHAVYDFPNTAGQDAVVEATAAWLRARAPRVGRSPSPSGQEGGDPLLRLEDQFDG
jgi:pimeloyl-ACP methyl ester carboxylesterase